MMKNESNLYALRVTCVRVLRIVKLLTVDATSMLFVGAAGVIAGIWLAWLHEWYALALGVVLMISLVAFGVRIVLLLSLWLFRRAENVKGLRRLYLAGTESFCLVGIIVLWHYAVLYVFASVAASFQASSLRTL